MSALDSAKLQSLRDSHALSLIVEKLGFSAQRRRIFCPRCQADGGKTPDLAIYDDSLHCFKCGWHPDLFAFIQQCLGIGFRESVAWLEQQGPGRVLEKKSARRERDFTLSFRRAQASAHLHEDRVDAYLNSRGFSFEQLKRYIGYLPDEQWIGRPSGSGRLVFPHFAYADARVVPNLYGRAIDPVDDDLRHDHGAAARGFWSPSPVKARTSSHLVLTEGVFDALGLMAMGSPYPVVTVFGVQGFRLEKFPMLRHLTIAFDQDKAGREKAHELSAKADSLGICCELMPEEVYQGQKDLGEAWAFARSQS